MQHHQQTDRDLNPADYAPAWVAYSACVATLAVFALIGAMLAF